MTGTVTRPDRTEPPSGPSPGVVLALCGGVGGAKLAFGLDRVLPAGALTLAVNTGDDFEHLGLSVSPDIDTVLYTLSGLADRIRGWGRADESWNFMAALADLGGETWFSLGDRDLALHVERTRRLRAGEPLGEITAAFAAALGLRARIVPMTDDPVRTLIHTPAGPLPFQRYFVEHRCAPEVRAISFDGAAAAAPHPAILAALADPRLTAILLCPSNPWLSIDPILSLPGLRDALRAAKAPVIAVSPLIGGKAVKGPTAKIMAELRLEISNRAVLATYDDFLDALVIDESDAAEAATPGLPLRVARTLMVDDSDRIALARAVLALAGELGRAPKAARRGGRA